MRLVAQAKHGFYPAAPEAVALMLNHLSCDDPRQVCIFDPCCGAGEALGVLVHGLSVPLDRAYAVELHQGRAALANANLPGSNVVGPASFFGVDISPKSFGLVYCNPPFDYAGDGHGTREEQNFLSRSYDLLAANGICILVCPLKEIIGRSQLAIFWDTHFSDTRVYRFPDGFRPYNEVAVFGIKRKEILPDYSANYDTGSISNIWRHENSQFDIQWLPQLGERQPKVWEKAYVDVGYDPRIGRNRQDRTWRAKNGIYEDDVHVWKIPHSWKPRRFTKNQFTDEELAESLAASQLWMLLRDPEPQEPQRPPLALGKGHTSLAIVSGVLDGVVPSSPPHVARGYSVKSEYLNVAQCKSEENPETGAVSETKVYSEKPVSVVRCVEVDEHGEPNLFEYRSDAQVAVDDTDEAFDEEE